MDVSHFNLSVGVVVMKLMDDTHGTANCNNYSTEKLRQTFLVLVSAGLVSSPDVVALHMTPNSYLLESIKIIFKILLKLFSVIFSAL